MLLPFRGPTEQHPFHSSFSGVEYLRLCGCAGRSAPLLFAYGINRFSHDVADLSFKGSLLNFFFLFLRNLRRPVYRADVGGQGRAC